MIKIITTQLFRVPYTRCISRPGSRATPTEKIPTIEELDYWLSPLSTEEQALEFLRGENLLADDQDAE